MQSKHYIQRILSIDMQTAQSQTMDDGLNVEQEGIALSKKCKWSGTEVLEVTIHALIDSNFHKEAAEIKKILDRVYSEVEYI